MFNLKYKLQKLIKNN